MVQDVEKGCVAESKVAPLVAGLDEGADETSDDHDPVGEDDEEDGGPGHAGCEEEVKKEQGRRDEPVDVADIEDFAELYMESVGCIDFQEERSLC